MTEGDNNKKNSGENHMAMTEAEVRLALAVACVEQGEKPCGMYEWDPLEDVYRVPVGVVPPRTLNIRGRLVAEIIRQKRAERTHD